MFLPKEGKTGFVVYVDQIDFWEPKAMKQSVSSDEVVAIVEHIRAEFSKAGNTVEFESA